jgi:hypothetical protein
VSGAPLVGYAFLEVGDDFESVAMADLRPGDVFRFVEVDDDDERCLFNSVVLNERSPLEQRRGVLRGYCRRAARYRWTEAVEFVPGRSGGRAVPIESA